MLNKVIAFAQFISNPSLYIKQKYGKNDKMIGDKALLFNLAKVIDKYDDLVVMKPGMSAIAVTIKVRNESDVI
jgi:hypothetical protein